MPTFDEELRDRIDEAAPRVRHDRDLFDALAARKRRRAAARKVGTVATVAVVLVGTIVAFALIDRGAHTSGPVGEPSPTPVANLGMPYAICRVSSMPFDAGVGAGRAHVFTKESEAACPERGKGTTIVGIDLDGNGVLDTTSAPIPDCSGCEAFATPDVNGDGISEIAISTAGADGYDISLFAVTTSPATIEALQRDGEPFTFAWVNVVTHADTAHCRPGEDDAREFVLDHTEWDQGGASVTEQILIIEGTTVTLAREHRYGTASDEAPVPGDELCGVPVRGSAAPDPSGGSTVEGRDIGLQTNVCDVGQLGGLDLFADDVLDIAWTGYLVSDAGRCPADRQRWIVAVDLTGDGEADASTDAGLVNCPYVGCHPLDATDLDGDGDQELIVTTQFSIQDQGYFAATKEGGRASIEPILVADPGHPAAGIQPGEPLMTSAGGDEGYAAWIRCEGYPGAPTLVFTFVDGIVESSKPKEWHEVQLRLEADGMFHVTAATDLSLPPGQDPGLIRSSAPACGVDFNLFG